jgi:hypothetical protein
MAEADASPAPASATGAQPVMPSAPAIAGTPFSLPVERRTSEVATAPPRLTGSGFAQGRCGSATLRYPSRADVCRRRWLHPSSGERHSAEWVVDQSA